jgi:hypothetical protein
MIAVITTNRNQDYLAETIRQIDESARSKKKVVILDSHKPAPPDFPVNRSWEVIQYLKPTYHRHNKWVGWKAFEVAAESGEDLCFFEDDLELGKNVALYIENFKIPEEMAFVAFFDSYLPKTIPMGLWRIHGHAFQMSQAVKFRADKIKDFLAYRNSPSWQRLMAVIGFDEMIKHCAIENKFHYGIHQPSLVQHVGAVSAVGNGHLDHPSRVSHSYQGKELDPHKIFQDFFK